MAAAAALPQWVKRQTLVSAGLPAPGAQLHIPATGGPGTWTIFLNRGTTTTANDAIYRVAAEADQAW